LNTHTNALTTGFICAEKTVTRKRNLLGGKKWGGVAFGSDTNIKRLSKRNTQEHDVVTRERTKPKTKAM